MCSYHIGKEIKEQKEHGTNLFSSDFVENSGVADN